MKLYGILFSTLLFLVSCSDTTHPVISDGDPITQPEEYVSSEISETEMILLDAYREEILAETIYQEMFKTYPTLSEISNIINSEERHSEQVGRLLDQRAIPRPRDLGKFSQTFEELREKVLGSLTGAIEVGVMIEMGDIDHLREEYQRVQDSDIKAVFEQIGGGSFQHLRAFLRMAEKNSYKVLTDYSRYMSGSDISSRGPIQYKMTEILNKQ